MVRNDFDFGEEIEYTGENHTRHKNTRLVRPAKNPPKFVFRFFLGLIVRKARSARRIHPNRYIEVSRLLEDRQEIGLIERASIYVRKSLHADSSKLFYGT